jgi:hypothetical protein
MPSAPAGDQRRDHASDGCRYPNQGLGGYAEIGRAVCKLRETPCAAVRPAFSATGSGVFMPYHIALLAKTYEIAGQVEEASTLLDDALQIDETTEERWFAAELNRAKGQLLLRRVAKSPRVIDEIRFRKPGSHQTPRWREGDSNPRSPVRGATLFSKLPRPIRQFPFGEQNQFLRDRNRRSLSAMPTKNL